MMSAKVAPISLLIAALVWPAMATADEATAPPATTTVDPIEAAREVDRLLRLEVPYTNGPPERIDDERFLRRVSLDTIGQLPSPNEVQAFVQDTAKDKRIRVVEKLLADERYGENWGRYWRDVIMYRKSEERDRFFVDSLEEYLVESFRNNKPWSQIATEMVTAKGDALENGACGLILAQQGQPEETVAEVSRIFLGVQIQCAQCHDHPTDRWTREQFHQLAAFFPRVASQIIPPAQGREPRVMVSVNDSPFGGRMRAPMNRRFRGTLEHRMSDLNDPASPGKLMQPVFFATGDSVPTGTSDAERRGALADWMTASSNPYFAKAFVNRMWSELNGEGFYEPVDDIGPDRDCVAPKTLDYFAGQFAASGYDVHWLLRTIMATELYHAESRSRRGPEDAPMQHNVAQRLRADQFFDNLLAVLEIEESRLGGRMRPGMMPGGMAPAPAGLRRAFSPRAQFTRAFGYDPSERRDEVATSIPQALLLMNSPFIDQAMGGGPARPGRGRLARPGMGIPGIRPRGGQFGFGPPPGPAMGMPGMPGSGRSGMLGRLLGEHSDNESFIEALYLQVLSRRPSKSELKTCLQYVNQVPRRTEAAEDILWSLLNSTEFLHRT